MKNSLTVFSCVFLVVAAAVVFFLVGGGPACADTLFSLDTGVANDVEENNANGELMWVNHYTTPGGQPYSINQIGVAFANDVYQNASPATIESQTVYVDLYKDTGVTPGNPNNAVQVASGSFITMLPIRRAALPHVDEYYAYGRNGVILRRGHSLRNGVTPIRRVDGTTTMA